MIRLLCICVILLTHYCGVFAQTDLYRSLAQGDIVPDVTFSVWEDAQLKKVKLSDYQGKLVILDFWGVHCSQCIPGISKLAELQKQFKEEIVVLLVTSDSKEDVEKLWEKLRRNPVLAKHAVAGKQSTLVTGDTLFKKLFPYEGQPTHVWINRHRQFEAMTSGLSTVAGNIKLLLAGERPDFEDEQKLIGIDKNNPLSWVGKINEPSDAVPYYSFIVKGPVGPVPTGFPVDYTPTSINFTFDSVTNSIIEISCINNPIISLYKVAFQKEMPQFVSIPQNRILVESSSLDKFYYNRDRSFFKWANDNMFSYALKVPVNQAAEFFKLMQADLNRHFNLESFVQRRMVHCLVLKKSDGLKTAGTKQKSYKPDENSDKSSVTLVFKDVGMGTLIDYIKDNLSVNDNSKPFFDETNHSGSINLVLDIPRGGSANSFVFLQNELAKFGFSLKYEVRELEMLVIKEKAKR